MSGGHAPRPGPRPDPIRPDGLATCCVDAIAGHGRGAEGARVGCVSCGSTLGFRAGSWEWVGRAPKGGTAS